MQRIRLVHPPIGTSDSPGVGVVQRRILERGVPDAAVVVFDAGVQTGKVVEGGERVGGLPPVLGAGVA